MCNRGSANEYQYKIQLRRDRATNDTDPTRGDQAIYAPRHRFVGTNRQSHKIEQSYEPQTRQKTSMGLSHQERTYRLIIDKMAKQGKSFEEVEDHILALDEMD